MKVTPQKLQEKKDAGQKITILTAYDIITARQLETASIDIALVGDSLGNVILGHNNTIPVTMEDIIHHTKAVSRGLKNTLLLADMPFMSYQISPESAKENAGRLVKEAGAEALKLEVGDAQIKTITEITSIGIPVMAHIGFTPQAIHQIGGYKIQGKTEDAKDAMKVLAQKCQDAGAFAVLLEMVPAAVAESITKVLRIPTIGIGAGPNCDGQVLVTQDILGIGAGPNPKFVKRYAELDPIINNAIKNFKAEVETGVFPDDAHSY